MKVYKKEDGSITLEAAMVLPIFMLFVVFVASFIRISVVEIALNKSVSETAKVISSHAYPATILTEKAKDLVETKISGVSASFVKLGDVEKMADKTFRELLDIDVSSNSLISSLTNNKVNKSVKKHFENNINSNYFSSDKLSTEVELPTSINGDKGAYIGITATYDLKIVAPFISKSVKLKKRAYERLWVGSM